MTEICVRSERSGYIKGVGKHFNIHYDVKSPHLLPKRTLNTYIIYIYSLIEECYSFIIQKSHMLMKIATLASQNHYFVKPIYTVKDL